MNGLQDEKAWSIRAAGVSDLPVLIEFRERMFRSFSFYTGPCDYVKFAEVSRDQLEADMASGDCMAWVAVTADGETIGCCALSAYRLPPKPWNPFGRFGYISSMYTKPEFRRRGVASGLLKTAIRRAGEQGMVDVTLHAAPDAVGLYESVGFARINEMRLSLPQSDERC